MAHAPVILHDYWRSSASYRVRIALNLAGIAYECAPVDLLKSEHKAPEHLARNPQGLVPALSIDGLLITQSLAIIDYLAEAHGLKILPAEPAQRAKVRAVAHAIAMDIHPVCNLGVVNHAVSLAPDGDAARGRWMKKFIGEGLAAVEVMLQAMPGPLCHDEAPSLADICLAPQLYNARRWAVDLSQMPRITGIERALAAIPAFARAAPVSPA